MFEQLQGRFRQRKIDFCAFGGQVIRLQFRAGEVPFFGQAFGPFEFVPGALELFAGEVEFDLIL